MPSSYRILMMVAFGSAVGGVHLTDANQIGAITSFTNAASGIFLFREVFNAIAEVYEWPDFGPAPKRVVTLSVI